MVGSNDVRDDDALLFERQGGVVTLTLNLDDPELPDGAPAPIDCVAPIREVVGDQLELIVDGLSNQEIGQRLHISLSTVKGHTTQIYGKLNVSNRVQAVARARSLGLLPFI